MKTIFTALLLIITSSVFGQTAIQEKWQQARLLLELNKYAAAYPLLEEIERVCDKKDTLYPYIAWYHTSSATFLEKQFRDNQAFDSSLAYGLKALELIRKYKPLFDDQFAVREYWMTKNIIVSYFGLGQLDKAGKYKETLYTAYKEKRLPKGIDEYFNFHFFKWEDKNVWGYEWFEELPENRFSKSFSKIVYYVYSTNPDGSDKEQLYRLHVLMFHKADNAVKFDYVLTKRLEKATNEVSGTLYAYTYEKNIDYRKLLADIRQVLAGNYQPASKKD